MASRHFQCARTLPSIDAPRRLAFVSTRTIAASTLEFRDDPIGSPDSSRHRYPSVLARISSKIRVRSACWVCRCDLPPRCSSATERRSPASADSLCTADTSPCRSLAAVPLLQLLKQLALFSSALVHGVRLLVGLTRLVTGVLSTASCKHGAVVVALIHQLQNLLLAFGLHIDEFLGRLEIDLVRIECLHSLRVQFIEQPFIEPVANALNPKALAIVFSSSSSSDLRSIRISCEALN